MSTLTTSPLPLRAGALTAEFYPDELFLRYARVGAEECLRGVYLAIRDQDWNTPAPEVAVKSLDEDGDSFELALEARWRFGDIRYRADCRLTGGNDRMAFRFRGVAESDFLRNRLGFVVLHGAQLAGRSVSIEQVNGSILESRFPEDISPHQPFFDVRAMTHELADGLQFKTLMEGDTFETEDQRNWTDASFKTYCTPLGLPFPVAVKAGEVVEQAITIELLGGGKSRASDARGAIVELSPDQERRSYRLPRIGIETAADLPPEEWSEATSRHLERLNLDHLRAALHAHDSESLRRIERAQQEAEALDCGLEVVLFVKAGDDVCGLLAQVKERLSRKVDRWIVFDVDAKATPPATTAVVRAALSDVGLSGPAGAGTDHFFTELNRDRSAVEGTDFVSFSMNPQVHAFDDRSLIETMEMQGICVNSARSFSEDRPIVVSPLTFKMRSNPNATGADDATLDRSARVDERQHQAFGAVWTLGSLKYLTEAEAYSVTLFELLGPLGLVDLAGDPYPLFEAIAMFTRFKGGALSPLVSTDPLKAIGFDLQSANRDERLRVLVNLSSSRQSLRCEEGVFDLNAYEYKTWRVQRA